MKCLSKNYTVYRRYHEEDRLLESNPKYDFWFKRGLSMLNVNEVTPDDSGKYSDLNKARNVKRIFFLIRIFEPSVRLLAWLFSEWPPLMTYCYANIGDYTCVATNTVGQCSTMGELHVQGKAFNVQWRNKCQRKLTQCENTVSSLWCSIFRSTPYGVILKRYMSSCDGKMDSFPPRVGMETAFHR